MANSAFFSELSKLIVYLLLFFFFQAFEYGFIPGMALSALER